MLLVSTRISLVVCRCLVEYYDSMSKITAPELSARYNINVRIINTSLRNLVRVGILKSQVGGSDPGFIFARDPREISLLDIVSALEGDKKMLCCKDVLSGIKCDMYSCDDCLIYTSVNDNLMKLRNKLKSISVFDHYLSSKNSSLDSIDILENLDQL